MVSIISLKSGLMASILSFGFMLTPVVATSPQFNLDRDGNRVCPAGKYYCASHLDHHDFPAWAKDAERHNEHIIWYCNAWGQLQNHYDCGELYCYTEYEGTRRDCKNAKFVMDPENHKPEEWSEDYDGMLREKYEEG